MKVFSLSQLGVLTLKPPLATPLPSIMCYMLPSVEQNLDPRPLDRHLCYDSFLHFIDLLRVPLKQTLAEIQSCFLINSV